MDMDIKGMEEKWAGTWKNRSFSRVHGKDIFSIDTPPPTISGDLHMGHAFSYSHQDIVARYMRMKGKNVLYPFGFDNNGLATERYVEKALKVNLMSMELGASLKICTDKSLETIENMIVFFKRMGFTADFDKSYITYSREVWKTVQESFLELYGRGNAYRQDGMTVWCPTCRTAISQIEMVDRTLGSEFVYLRFHSDDSFIDIATTRPEMIGACVALAINPEDPRMKDLEGKEFHIPIYGGKVKLITDSRVKIDKGTGAEMICTFGDQEDYDVWKTHGLELKTIVDRKGIMRENGPLEGLRINEARKKIRELLKNEGFVLKTESIQHSVNVHERCDTPVEVSVSTQWYARYMDLKEKLIEQGRKVQWHPDFMRIRYENWVNGLKWDWCISRQRILGIPIPVWYCRSCNRIIPAEKSEIPVDPRFADKKACPHCGSGDVEPERDVMDTWFTSSLSPTIVNNIYGFDRDTTMNARFQAHEIISTWAFTTIYKSYIHYGKIPWNDAVISGNVFDSKGEKMSKSKGNVVLPTDIVEKYGADSLRLWCVSSSIHEDTPLREQELTRGRRTIIKIYNAIKLVSSMENGKWDGTVKLPFNRWILGEFSEALKKVETAYERYDLARARTEIDNLFWKHFCDNYLEMTKYYTQNGDDSVKGEIHAVAAKVAEGILRMYAPIIPFMAEEAHHMLGEDTSIHDQLWPVKDEPGKYDPGEFASAIQIIDGIRAERSKMKSSRTPYSGFNITCHEIPGKEVVDIIKNTLREHNLAFTEGEGIAVQAFI